MTKNTEDIDWNLTTFEGSRREQLRRALQLTVRERLEAVEDMADIARRFAEMRANNEFSHTADPDKPKKA
jgi:hypothetical protein